MKIKQHLKSFPIFIVGCLFFITTTFSQQAFNMFEEYNFTEHTDELFVVSAADENILVADEIINTADKTINTVVKEESDVPTTSFAIAPDANNILYVNKNVPLGGNSSGDSWANAIPELADALNLAQANPSWASSATPLKIYVAVGTYYPTAVATNRTASFILGADIKIHGGFDPVNGILALNDARIFAGNSITAGTILSGDIDGNDTLISPAPSNGNLYNNNAGNSYHVVNASTANTNSLLDGVRISHGNANGPGFEENGGGVFSYSSTSTSVVITNSTVSNNLANSGGGGVFSFSDSSSTTSSSVIITNSLVSNNSASVNGGGVFSDSSSTSSGSSSSSVIITNSLVSNNSASVNGGGVFSDSFSDSFFDSTSSVIITNSTMSNNSASGNGGGVFSDSYSYATFTSTITSNNSIFAGNTATNAGANYYNNLPTNTFTNSYVSGENLSASNNNLDGTAYSITDIFTNPANGDYSLKNTSPAVNAGDNSLYTGTLATDNDVAGNPRLFNGSPNPDVIDMGAYELQAEPLKPDANNILYVNKNVIGGNGSGDSWANAIPELADALNWAKNNPSWASSATPLKIYVAVGTYYPTADVNNRVASFILGADIKIHGGFDPANGIVALTDARIFAGNSITAGTILSGDIDHNTNPDTLISPAPSEGNLYNNNGGNSYHVVNASTANTNSLLDGVRISHGNANGTGLERNGGGVFSDSTSTSSVVITNSTVSNNSANRNGGGVYSTSTSTSSSSVVITNSTVSNNNSANSRGGGVFSDSYSTSSVVITNSTVSNNLANSDGGGVYSFSDSSSVIITNSLVSNNSASYSGGGVFSTSTSFSSSSSVVITNSTVSNNSANHDGGGVFSDSFYSSSTITSNNSIFAGNTATNAGANYYNNRTTNTFTNSYVSGENLSGSNNNLDGTAYSITDIFIDPANGDYSLKNTSPAVNAGNNSLYTNAGGSLTTDNDVAGNPRLFNGSPNPDIIDMGAYELQENPLTPDVNNIFYVNKHVIGGNGSGDSWANAIPELADALNWAKNNPSWASSATPLKIYVAVGTYYPTAVANNRTASFILGADWSVYL